MILENTPGLSTVIVKGGEIVWLNHYGLADVGLGKPVTDSTVFLLASISKLFTSTAVVQLMETGQLQLDDPISGFLPFPVQHPLFPDSSITFRMLLTHTSGIQDNWTAMDGYYSTGDPDMPLEEVIQRYFDPTGVDYDPNANFLAAPPWCCL